MAAARLLGFLVATFLLAQPALACSTMDDVVNTTKGERSRVTVISETGALSRALSFMLGHADEVQTADALVVIEKGFDAEVVLMQRGCATMKAVSSPEMVAELLRKARGESDSDGELI